VELPPEVEPWEVSTSVVLDDASPPISPVVELVFAPADVELSPPSPSGAPAGPAPSHPPSANSPSITQRMVGMLAGYGATPCGWPCIVGTQGFPSYAG
jgi:hypothetical protein